MLRITIPAIELFDDVTQEFVNTKECVLQLEHSLVSISKWEAKWGKVFLSKDKKTFEEATDYIKCMTLTQNVPAEVYSRLTSKNINEVNRYIEAPMTATFFAEEQGGRINREATTSELIYYWMISLNVPFECQKWHLSRLLTLIRVCNLKNKPPKKRSKREIMRQNTALNAARRKKLGTTG